MNRQERVAMGEAVGIVELFGLVAAFAAADAGCKAGT